MPTTLALPAGLHDDALFAFLPLLHEHDDCDHLTLDFGPLRFARPFGALLLAEYVKDMVARRKAGGLYTECAGLKRDPEWGTALSYLSHVGFFRHVGLAYGAEPSAASGSSTYMPITPISRDELTPHSGMDAFYKEIERKCHALASIVTPLDECHELLFYAFRELIRNVFEHGLVESCTLMGQKYRRDLELVVVDRGRGIHASLAERWPRLSAKEALKAAILPGVTRVPDTSSPERWSNTGFGLYVLSELGRRTGQFLLASSRHYYSMTTVGYRLCSFPFDGTIVKLSLSTDDAEYFPNLLEHIVQEGESQARGRSSQWSISKTL